MSIGLSFFRSDNDVHQKDERDYCEHGDIAEMIKTKKLDGIVAPGRRGSNFKSVITENLERIKFMSYSCAIALKGMLQNTYDCKSTLVQVMDGCLQATITRVNVDTHRHVASLGRNEKR